MAQKKATRPRAKAGAMSGLAEIWKRHRNHYNAAEAVYMTLREAILHGALPAGYPLGEIPLAEVFGRSRTPIREAILKLESEKLAERFSRRGLVVAQITREEVLEVYAVREMLDGFSARLAALGTMPAELDRLTWLNERLRDAANSGDAKAMIELNIEFHEGICQASRNSLLLEFVQRIHEWVRRFSDTTMSQPGRGLEAVAEHEALLEAIRARDPDAAERIARDHMGRARQLRVHMLQSAAMGAYPSASQVPNVPQRFTAIGS
ncbi:MAG: GntR family transcriptional regulator [Gammaproteobacteria bacterium]|nr:GntR family transcriptional regulator [Gammaproteobacteria bacterium]